MTKQAEQALLGAMIMCDINPKGFVAEDFKQEKHKVILEAIRGLSKRTKSVGCVMLANELLSLGCLSSIGGITYIVALEGAYRQGKGVVRVKTSKQELTIMPPMPKVRVQYVD